jgi:hypothetical protein
LKKILFYRWFPFRVEIKGFLPPFVFHSPFVDSFFRVLNISKPSLLVKSWIISENTLEYDHLWFLIYLSDTFVNGVIFVFTILFWHYCDTIVKVIYHH